MGCRFAASRGSSFQISCAKTVAAGGVQTEICSKIYESGSLAEIVGGKVQCMRPLAETAAAADADEDIAKTTDPGHLRAALSPEARQRPDRMNRHEAPGAVATAWENAPRQADRRPRTPPRS